MLGFWKRNKQPGGVSFEQQVAILNELGVRINPDRTVDELLEFAGREECENDPFRTLLLALGGAVESEPWGRNYSDDVWLLDTECIEDHGDYVRFAENMARVTRGALVLDDIRDEVDIEAGRAELRFRCGDRAYTIEMEQNDDWINTKSISAFVDLAKEYGVPGRYTYLDTGGQSCLIGYATETQLKQIRKRTGLDMVWLT